MSATRLLPLLLTALLLCACRVSVHVGDNTTPDNGGGTTPPTHYVPPATLRWQLQLQGTPQLTSGVALYELDLFDTPDNTIRAIQTRGARLLCYFSAGTLETWRADASTVPDNVRGAAVDGWPNEYWLDIRTTAVRDLMRRRLDRARARGCDGVDPDNVDGYLQNSGFPLTAANQLDFNRFLAREAHARGLAIALKNNLNQVATLVGDFDLAINEQCHAYQECSLLQPFVRAGKAVLNIEYADRFVQDTASRQQLCDEADLEGFNTQVLTTALDGTIRLRCDQGTVIVP